MSRRKDAAREGVVERRNRYIAAEAARVGLTPAAFVELQSVLTDAIERAWQRLPVESWREHAVLVSSDYARAAADRIWDALADAIRATTSGDHREVAP